MRRSPVRSMSRPEKGRSPRHCVCRTPRTPQDASGSRPASVMNFVSRIAVIAQVFPSRRAPRGIDGRGLHLVVSSVSSARGRSCGAGPAAARGSVTSAPRSVLHVRRRERGRSTGGPRERASCIVRAPCGPTTAEAGSVAVSASLEKKRRELWLPDRSWRWRKRYRPMMSRASSRASRPSERRVRVSRLKFKAIPLGIALPVRAIA